MKGSVVRLILVFVTALALALASVLAIAPGLADTKTSTTTDAKGNTVTTTVTTSNPAGGQSYQEVTETTVTVKDKQGNVLSETTDTTHTWYETKGGKKIKKVVTKTKRKYNEAGGYHEDHTFNAVYYESGDTEDIEESSEYDAKGTKLSGEKTDTKHFGGEKKTDKYKWDPDKGSYVVVAMAGNPSLNGDPALNADKHYVRVTPHSQNGNGFDQGTYLAPLAGPQSEITGTVATQEAGPTGFYVATVTDSGSTQYYSSKTDNGGHFHLRLPKITGLAKLLLFREFDKAGRPDQGAACVIGKTAHLENTERVINPPLTGPAIVEANTAYERGGFAQGLVQLHTRGTDALTSKVLVDGSDRGIDTLAASDSSLVGKLHDDVSLGRHRIGARSGNQRTNEQQADIVTERFDPIAPMRSGEVRQVRLHIEGLGKDESAVTFDVSGAAEVASGGNSIRVPVNNGVATCDIRATHLGALIIRTLLHVALDLVAIIPPPGVSTVERIPTPTPTPQESLPPVIYKTPTPTPTPTETPIIPKHPPPHNVCYSKYEGYMEPTQGVWQDDYKFVDLPTKQLVRLSPHDFRAELDMVKDRDSLLFGIYRPVNESPQERRDSIVIRGETTYATATLAKVRFKLIEGGEVQKLYETPLQYTVYYKPPCSGIVHKWEAVVPSKEGIPPFQPFQFHHAGAYTLVAELLDKEDRPLGYDVTVVGKTVETHGPVVHFIPVFAGKEDPGAMNALEQHTEDLAETSAHYIPIYYPLTAEGLTTVYRKRFNLDALIRDATALQKEEGGVFSDLAQKLILPVIVRKYSAIGTIGVGRIVLVVDASAAKVMPLDADGNTASTKVIFVKDPSNLIAVAHEIIHTEPKYIWTDDQMLGDCKYDYHNNANTDVVNGVKDRGLQPNGSIIGHAYGVRTERIPGARGYYKEQGNYLVIAGINPRMAEPFSSHSGGADYPGLRERFYRAYEIMGAAGGPGNEAKKRWITQCSFWHLIDAFQKPQDPPLVQVSGLLARHNGKYGFIAQPFYNYDGLPDLLPGAASSWDIKLKSAEGRVLATYPFTPEWRYPDSTRDADAIALAYGVPDRADAASIEVDGPSGVLANIKRSAAAPSVTIDGIVNGSMVAAPGGRVRLHWSARSTTAQPLLSSVLYSPNGTVWIDKLFESTDHSYDLLVGAGTRDQWIKVTVTDGTRSSQRIVHFKTRR